MPDDAATAFSTFAVIASLGVRGAWEVVVVDELLPVSGDGVKTCVQLAYASCARRQLWAPLLEKAYAKICRGYSNLSGGDTAEALYVLTGCACGKTALSPSLSDEARELLWAELLSAHEAGFVTCLSSRATVRRGLSPRHAYAVLDVLSVGPRRLLRVANPHDTKPACLVEASVVAEARRRVPDDGRSVLFDLDDVLENFEHCCVCEYRSDWADVRLDAAPRDVYVVTAPEATEATLHYAQAPARARAGGPLDAALVVVAARDADGGGAAATATAGLGNAYCRCHLNGGEERYYVVPLSFNGAGAAQTCGVLVAQSARPLLLARAPHVDAALVRRCVLAYARSGAAPQRFGAVTHYARTDGCACYIAAENRDVGRWLRFTISFDDARGVVLSRGSPGNGTTVTSHVPPGHACVVVVAAARAEGFRYRASSKFQLGEAPPPGQEHAPPLPTPDDIHVPVPLDHFR